jgi:hypothetical protein
MNWLRRDPNNWSLTEGDYNDARQDVRQGEQNVDQGFRQDEQNVDQGFRQDEQSAGQGFRRDEQRTEGVREYPKHIYPSSCSDTHSLDPRRRWPWCAAGLRQHRLGCQECPFRYRWCAQGCC